MDNTWTSSKKINFNKVFKVMNFNSLIMFLNNFGDNKRVDN